MSSSWWEVGVGGAFAFAESMLGVGIVLPGEVVVTGIASTVDSEQRAALFLAVTAGATLGDHVNYWLGRFLGIRLGRSRLVARIGRQHWDRAIDLVRRHGAWAVVISRLLPVVRTLMAAVAGVSVMSYPRFALASLLGCALWAALWIGAGDGVRAIVTRPVLALPVVAILIALIVLRARRARRRAEP